MKLSYSQSLYIAIGSKLTIKTLEKGTWNRPKLIKKTPWKRFSARLIESDIHLSSCKESDFSGSDAWTLNLCSK